MGTENKQTFIPITPDLLDGTKNARGKEVVLSTGQVLQRIQFADFVKELGLEENSFEFKAITPASPAPTKTGLYFPMSAGKYPNYGGVEITDEQFDSSFIFIVFDGDSFQMLIKQVDFIPVGEVKEGDVRAVSGGEVYDYNKKLGFKTIPAGKEFISELIGSDINDIHLWTAGALRSDNGTISTSEANVSAYVTTKKSYLLPSNTEFNATFKLNGTIVGYAFFDATDAFISGGQTGMSAFTFTTPSNKEVYIRFSQLRSQATTGLTIKNKFGYLDRGASDVMYKDELNPILMSELDKFGIKTTPIGTNFFADLAGSSYDDTYLWGVGFIQANGTIATTQPTYRYSKKFYPLSQVLYSTKFLNQGNAKNLIYDANGGIVREVPLETTSIRVVEGEEFIRISVPVSYDNSVLKLVNQEVIYNDLSSMSIGKDNLIQGSDSPISADAVIGLLNTTWSHQRQVKPQFPMISFISDDGRIDNDWFIDVLNEFDYKATFAIVTSWIDKSVTNAYNADRLLQIANQGHELGGHTHTHPRLLTLTPEQQEQEIANCQLFLRQLDSRLDFPTFVSPWGERSVGIDKIVSKYFKNNCILNEVNTPVTAATLNNYYIPRYSIDQYDGDVSGPLHVSNLTALKAKVDELVINGKGWLIFVIHPQYREYTDANNTVNRKEDVRQLLQHIKSKNIPVLTTNQAFEYYKNQDIGYKGIDAKYYKRNITGEIEGNLFTL